MSESESESESETPRVVVIGGGVAGLTAATFTARAGFDTIVLTHGESILRRNAHVENVPGFPAGVNPRLFVDLLFEQAERNGARIEDARVSELRVGERFELRVDTAEEPFELRTDYAIVSSWSETAYLDSMTGLDLLARGSKTYVDVDDCGRTGIDGLYAAGRIAAKAHQAVVCAGHGAEVALALIEDSDVPFYHDWVAPQGYFTDRGREVPPGCEEIDDAERKRRERESIERMRAAFEEPYPAEPTPHPSLEEPQ